MYKPFCWRDPSTKSCVLSGRFTQAESDEFRELAAARRLPVKLLIRDALMEWKARQVAQ